MRFFVAHQIDGRTRLRALDRPVDLSELTAFGERLGRQAGIEWLDLRAATGSVVIEHPGLDAVGLAECVSAAGGLLDERLSGGGGNRLASVPKAVQGLDGMLSQLTSGGLDTRTLSFLVLFSLGITQLLRGQIMMPAFSFLWYAFELANRAAREADEKPDS